MKKITARKANRGVNWKALHSAADYAKTLKMSESSVPMIRKMRGHEN